MKGKKNNGGKGVSKGRKERRGGRRELLCPHPCVESVHSLHHPEVQCFRMRPPSWLHANLRFYQWHSPTSSECERILFKYWYHETGFVWTLRTGSWCLPTEPTLIHSSPRDSKPQDWKIHSKSVTGKDFYAIQARIQWSVFKNCVSLFDH